MNLRYGGWYRVKNTREDLVDFIYDGIKYSFEDKASTQEIFDGVKLNMGFIPKEEIVIALKILEEAGKIKFDDNEYCWRMV